MSRYASILITAGLGLLLVQPPAGAKCNYLTRQSTPTSDFTLNADGTVVHNTTGLMWMRCALGQSWNGSTCTGTATMYTWKQALQQAANATFVNHGDWRLPNFKELASIVELMCWEPAINSIVFPNVPATPSYPPGGIFWSASVDASSYGAAAWIVSFTYGKDQYSSSKLGTQYVRLVRGGLSFADFDLFAHKQYTLTVSKVGTGSGTLTSSPKGINCASGCQYPFYSGAVVTLMATPTNGSSFAGWYGDADCVDGQVAIDADKSCIATFTLP